MAREMKNSGVQWIGEIPSSWTTLSPRYWVVQRDAGNWGSDERGDDNDTVCIRIADFDYTRYCVKQGYEYTIRNYPKYLIKKLCLQKGDILIEKSGGGDKLPVGRTVMYNLNEPALFANFSERLRIDASNCAKYALYAFVAHYGLGLSRLYFNQTTGIQNLIMSEFMSGVKLPLPSLSEQKAIAAFLDSRCVDIDSLLADLDQEVKILADYKKSLIAETVTHGLNPSAPMKQSGIPWLSDVPAHWDIHPVYTYFDQRIHKNIFGTEQNLLSLSYGRIITKDIDILGGLLPASFNTYNIVEEGDIIIRPTDLQNDKRSLRTGLVREHGMITSAYIALKPKNNQNSAYFHYLLHTYDVMKVFYNMGNGVRQGLNYSEFSRLMLVAPPLEEQIAIANYLDEKCKVIDESIADKQDQIEKLKAYKASLIYEYVTGKKQVAL